MLVEVDVYKGPLTKSRTVQFGELAAVIEQGAALLSITEAQARGLAAARCSPEQKSPAAPLDCQQLNDVSKRITVMKELIMSAFPTKKAVELTRDVNRLLDLSQPTEGRKQAGRAVDDATFEATRIATQLKVEAFYWAEAQLAHMPVDQRIRSLLVGYINLASELSNQISSRTDVLAKQLSPGSTQGADLALSDNLKDAGPTDFLRLYEWYDAVPADGLSEGSNRLTPQDRARLARSLFSDHFWTRINQVHASGQGDLRMALIKDDIGNWNLKSFDNDPERLLSAYRNLTLAGIEAGIRVGRAIGSGGASAGLDLASQFARGRVGSTQTAAIGANRLETLRARAQSDLVALKSEVERREPELKAAEDAAQQEADRRQAEAASKAVVYKSAIDDRVAAEQKLALARQIGGSAAAMTKLEAELDDAYRQEDLRRQALVPAQDSERSARSALDSAQKRRRDFVTGIFAEARKSLEVHRRVIDSLKEVQGAPLAAPATPAATDVAAKPLQRLTGAVRRP